MICPECDGMISEDDQFCFFCKVQLWSPKTLKSWQLLESQCATPGVTARK